MTIIVRKAFIDFRKTKFEQHILTNMTQIHYNSIIGGLYEMRYCNKREKKIVVEHKTQFSNVTLPSLLQSWLDPFLFSPVILQCYVHGQEK